MELRKTFVFLLVACSACGTTGANGKGPYLAPGPLPAIGTQRMPSGAGTVPAVPGAAAARPAWSSPAGSAASGPSNLPSGLVGGLSRLPGARVPGVGPVHGLVVSVSLDGKPPSRDERGLIADVLGGGAGAAGATIARALEAASGGKFRLTFSALPGLVDDRRSDQVPDAARIRALATASLRSWTGQLDMAGFDNDGADGIAASPDDDGVLDFFLMAVEADGEVSSATVREGVVVPVSRGSKSLTTGPIHMLGLSRAGGDPLVAGIGLVLDAAGLEGEERFFPAGFPRIISTLARVRLGWVPTRVLDGAAPRSAVAPGEAVLIPLRDLAGGGGFWLVENDGRSTFATRVVRTAGDHFSPTETMVWTPGQPLILPLTRQMGTLGERAVLAGVEAPAVHFEGMPVEQRRTPEAVAPVRW